MKTGPRSSCYCSGDVWVDGARYSASGTSPPPHFQHIAARYSPNRSLETEMGVLSSLFPPTSSFCAFSILASVPRNPVRLRTIAGASRLDRPRGRIASPAYRRTAIMAPGREPKFAHLPLSTSGPIECAVTGTVLLNTHYLNKGSAFPREERREFNLTGLLPQSVQSLDQQLKRAYQQYATRQDDLAKNTFLASLKEQNEVLFYRVSRIELPSPRRRVLVRSRPRPAAGRPSQGDVQRHLHSDRRGCHSELFRVSSDDPKAASSTSGIPTASSTTCRSGASPRTLTTSS